MQQPFIIFPILRRFLQWQFKVAGTLLYTIFYYYRRDLKLVKHQFVSLALLAILQFTLQRAITHLSLGGNFVSIYYGN
jgi:hypothetical protein